MLTDQVLITALGFLRLHSRHIRCRASALPLSVWTKRRYGGRDAGTVETHLQQVTGSGPEALGATDSRR